MHFHFFDPDNGSTYKPLTPPSTNYLVSDTVIFTSTFDPNYTVEYDLLTSTDARQFGNSFKKGQWRFSWNIESTLYWFGFVFVLWLPLILGFLGMIGNITNIVVIKKMMNVTKDSCNIILLSLALSDLFIMCFYCWRQIFDLDNCFALGIANAFNWQLGLFLAFHPVDVGAQITCFLTALLAVQRCTGVFRPFKVRAIFSASNTKTFVVSIVVLVVLLYSPIYLDDLFKLIDGVIAPRITREVQDLSHIVNKLILRPLAILVVFGCNVSLLIKLKLARKWRKSASSHRSPPAVRGQRDQTTSSSARKTKDRKLTRMILAICVVFLVCFIPDSLRTAYELRKTHWRRRTNQDMEVVFDMAQSILVGANSSCNVVILYFTSSRYKAEFKAICGKKEDMHPKIVMPSSTNKKATP